MEGTGKRFKGKVAVVTASTQGIGFAIAERLGLEGASVVVSSRKQKNVEEAVEKLRAKGIDVLGVACHVSSREQRRDLIQKTVDKYGGIDILVSNAAANPSLDPIVLVPEPVLDKLWEINVKATILLVQEGSRESTFTVHGVSRRFEICCFPLLIATPTFDWGYGCLCLHPLRRFLNASPLTR